jgi:hypothetical protein
MLWKTVAAADRETITLEQVRETFGRWKGAPPERKPKAEKPAAGAEKPKRVLTDEQKAKMKAGRDAAKAKREAEKGAPAAEKPKPTAAPAVAAPSEDVTESEEEAVELVDWEHNFGTGAKLYKRLNYEGGVYVYDHESREYLGYYMEKTNKLKKSVADPLAVEDD